MQVLTSWMRFRIKRQQLLDLREMKKKLPLTFSQIFRACLDAMLIPKERKALLEILMRHIPQTASSLLVGHWSLAAGH